MNSKSPLLNVEVIQVFIESVKHTIETMTTLKLAAEPPITNSSSQIQTKIAGVVGIVSDIV